MNESEFENLNGKVEGKGLSLGMQLSMAYSNEFGYDPNVQIEINYSVIDTLVIRIIKIPDKKTAIKASYLVADNAIIKETKVVYAKYYWNEQSIALKY